MSRESKSWRKGEGIFAAGWGATDADSGWIMLELVGPGSGQLIAQHKRARDVAGESSCPTAALQQAIMPMSMLVCIWTPAETLPHSAATRTRDVNHFNIARADSTYRLQRLSSNRPPRSMALSACPASSPFLPFCRHVHCVLVPCQDLHRH
jgi:hypothetical protein